MSSNPTGVTYDIRLALDKFRKDLRDAEAAALASAARIKSTSAAAAPSTILNAGDEARERFLATQRAQRVDAERQTTNELGNQAAAGERMLGAFVKLSLAVLAIKSTVAVIGSGIELWGALTADSQKKFEEAAKGYLSFADKLSSIPIVGSIARQGAELLSGGAGAATTKALADAQAIEAHTLQIKAQIAQHAKDEADSEQAILAAKIAQLPADQQVLATAKQQHDAAIAEIDRRVKAKEIGQDTGQNLKTAEDIKLQT